MICIFEKSDVSLVHGYVRNWYLKLVGRFIVGMVNGYHLY